MHNNNIKTILLLATLSLIVIGLGGVLGGQAGLIVALVFAVLINGVSFFFSDKLALAASGAKPITAADYPQIFQRTKILADRMGLPMPKMYLSPDLQANAFATGRDPQHAAVAITQGLLNHLNSSEVEAVIAHELAHIKNRDILISSVAAVLASVLSFLANMAMFGGFSQDDGEESSPFGFLGVLALSLLAPIAGMLVQMGISRAREFEADATAKRALGTGQYLASALRNIHRSVHLSPNQELNPAFASMYIANPIGPLGNRLTELLSTHPPVEERIKKLVM
jgi:heat shock protein HtpX